MPVALRRPLAACAALLVLLAVLPSPRAAGAEPAPAYRPPVDAEVTDPFRAPTHPYGPGNRGLEYGTEPGTDVRAAGAGRVVFAGFVAGSRHVTVLHPDGLRTTVSYLATIAVVVGQEVDQGELLGTTAGRLFFSARQAFQYFDPASLFADGPPRVWLVPFDDPPGDGIEGERSGIRQLLGLGKAVVRGIGNAAADVAGAAVDAASDATEWVSDHGPEILRIAAQYGPMLVPELRAVLLTVTAVSILKDAWDEWHRPCTPGGDTPAPPKERRIAVLVAGLGSTGSSGDVKDVDVAELGYEPEDVVRLSYRGGRTPDSTGHPPGVPVSTYSKRDSQQDLHLTGEALADLVEDLAHARPGVPIDIIGHSQGGLVARLGLAELERRGTVGPVGHLATIATPHGGAHLASAVRLVDATPAGDLVVDRIAPAFGFDGDAPTAAQLSIAGDLVHELASTPLPPVDAVTIAGRTDYVVPVQQTTFEGARSVVIPTWSTSAHAELPGDPRTTRELALAFSGAPPTCVSMVDAVLDQAAGRAIAEVEDQATLVAVAEALHP